MNKYNVFITYSGEGSFKFTVSKLGELEITAGKPIYVYNASVQLINDLRQLRRNLINVKINATPEGAFKIYDLDNFEGKTQSVREVVRVVAKEETKELESIPESGNTNTGTNESSLGSEKKEASKKKTTSKKSNKKINKK